MSNRLGPALLALALLLALLLPGRAAAQGGTPPELASLRTVRDTTLLLFDGRPLQVCQREWQSWNRVHGVCQDLATATLYDQQLIRGTIVEFVLFDGVRYERVNEQTAWSATADERFFADRDLGDALFRIAEEAQVTPVGAVELAGAATTHYQYWVLDEARNEAAGGQVVYDQFVTAAGHVAQSQTHVRGVVPGLGDGVLTEIRSFSDFNGPIVVVAPGG
jgi:hypothetical protein